MEGRAKKIDRRGLYSLYIFIPIIIASFIEVIKISLIFLLFLSIILII